jgi:hypothetical protein
MHIFSLFNCVLIFYQIPFWYQQALSYEKTPTLCGTVAAFEGFLRSLHELQDALEAEGLAVWSIIQHGIDKVEDYSSRTLDAPAYVISVGKWLFYKAA